MRYNIQGDNLCYGNEVLGPTSALYVDFNELREAPLPEGVIRRQLPHRIDMVFVAGDKVVGCESKKPMDLVLSHADYRLSRQIKTIASVCDITVVLVRGGMNIQFLSSLTHQEEVRRQRWTAQELFLDLFIRYPQLGVYVLGVPDDDEFIPIWLEMYRSSLADAHGAIKAIVRTDRPQRFGSKPGEFLRNIPGIGKATASKLYKAFGTTKAALNAPRKKWLELKVSKKVVDARDKVLE